MVKTAQKLTVAPEVMMMATAVGPKAELQSLQLVGVAAKLELDGTESERPQFVNNARQHAFRRDGDSRVIVELEFSLAIAMTEEEKKDPPVAIEGRYRLTYAIQDLASFDDAHLDAFSQVNGYFNGWPFWRELSSTLLARMRSGQFLLPSLKVEVKGPSAKQ